MVANTIALLRAYLLSDVEDDAGDEGDGGQEGHGGQQGHGDNPPLERYAAAVDALRQDGSTRVKLKIVSGHAALEDLLRSTSEHPHWRSCPTHRHHGRLYF